MGHLGKEAAFCLFRRHRRRRGLPQLLLVLDPVEGGKMIVEHGDAVDEDGAEIQQRETVHEGFRIMLRHIAPQRRIKENHQQNLIVQRQDHRVFHAAKVVEAEGNDDDPQDRKAVVYAGDGIIGEYHDADKQRGKNRHGPGFQHPDRIGDDQAGKENKESCERDKALPLDNVHDRHHTADKSDDDADPVHHPEVPLRTVLAEARFDHPQPECFDFSLHILHACQLQILIDSVLLYHIP